MRHAVTADDTARGWECQMAFRLLPLSHYRLPAVISRDRRRKHARSQHGRLLLLRCDALYRGREGSSRVIECLPLKFAYRALSLDVSERN